MFSNALYVLATVLATTLALPSQLSAKGLRRVQEHPFGGWDNFIVLTKKTSIELFAR
jgi:hypothetical protein